MSKSSQQLKNSKAGRRTAAKKSAEKSAQKIYQKRLEAASAPVNFSLKRDNFGGPLSNLVQLTLLALGIFALVFAIVFSGTFISDFMIAAEDGYSIIDYFNSCEPALACRFMDFSEIFVILSMLIISVLSLRAALTNRYPHRRTLIFGTVLLVLAVILYGVDFVLGRVLW